MRSLGRKGHHRVCGRNWALDKPLISTFPEKKVSDGWIRDIKNAPLGESLTAPNKIGTMLYINKTEDDTFVCPVSKHSFINRVYRLTTKETT